MERIQGTDDNLVVINKNNLPSVPGGSSPAVDYQKSMVRITSILSMLRRMETDISSLREEVVTLRPLSEGVAAVRPLCEEVAILPPLKEVAVGIRKIFFANFQEMQQIFAVFPTVQSGRDGRRYMGGCPGRTTGPCWCFKMGNSRDA
ncbi:hypothetical protein HOY82DRAFT_672506 [Tuber indicum]|nr:hypothetical protein HOY82DRAFT_672506 [Tuber indicum]